MKTDRELLELAAKAAGYEVQLHPNRKSSRSLHFIHDRKNWNPLTDDGDTMRLATELKLVVDTENARAIIGERLAAGHNDWIYGDLELEREDDEAVRRAVVLTAAAIGESIA